AYYDPSEDIESFHSSSHLVLVTVRIVDHALDSLVKPLQQIRKASPDRPVLLVLTCLHEASPERDLSDGPELVVESKTDQSSQAEMSEQLNQLVDLKRKQFAGLVDSIALIDFTHEDDGFANDGFGEHRLKQLILEMLPAAYRQTWSAAMATKLEGKSELQRRSHWQILASSALAATASAVPLPWVNLPVVLAIQTRMVGKIAWIYEQKMTSKHWFALSNVAGTQVALRLASRELLKFIPFVGIAASIASSFAFTFALGKVADWYFSVHAQGKTPTDEELRTMFAEQLARGRQLWGTTPK
ncbi:MAG: YcjF family protein, partial [Pirellula sp.]